jgi:rare lipoprotein A (peptidoglycan hydrolase)
MNKPLDPFQPPKFDFMNFWFIIPAVIAAVLFFCFLFITFAHAEEIPTQGYATYYTVASCLKESGQYRMANGRLLNDEAYTAASWYYKFGTRLIITNATGKSVIVTVTDRGPAKRLVKKGKIIDLSLRAFREIADIKQGVISVTVEKI